MVELHVLPLGSRDCSFQGRRLSNAFTTESGGLIRNVFSGGKLDLILLGDDWRFRTQPLANTKEPEKRTHGKEKIRSTCCVVNLRSEHSLRFKHLRNGDESASQEPNNPQQGPVFS